LFNKRDCVAAQRFWSDHCIHSPFRLFRITGNDRMAGDAEKNCPVSKVINAEITLDAKLV
jgi:hypothetical protein